MDTRERHPATDALFYVAIVALANLITTVYGPAASIPVALVLIGATITVRDRLHERWQGNKLLLRMTILIVSAGAISALINIGAIRISIASFIAFLASEFVDTGVYHRLIGKRWGVKVNASNTASALFDSVLFPLIAWGAFMPLITLGQFVVKVLGGWVWSHILKPRSEGVQLDPRTWKPYALVVLLFLSAPASGQILTLGAGAVTLDGESTEATVEAYAATAPWKTFRLYTIAAYGTESNEWTHILNVDAKAVQVGRWEIRPSVGALFLRFRDWEPTPTVGFTVLRLAKTKPVFIFSYATELESWSLVVKVDRTILFRR